MKLNARFRWLLAVLVISSTGKGFAQNPNEITTDRPDQSNTPILIPKGALQVETGFTREDRHETNGVITNYTFNTALIKVGVNEYFEFRLNTEFLGTRSFAQNEITSGFGPVSIGLKIKLSDEKSLWPQAALITHLNFNTGAREFNESHTTGDVTLALAHSLSEKFSLCYNAGIKWNGSTAAVTLVATASLGYSITSRFAAFVETYSEFPENESAVHNLDGGVTFKLNPVFQLDTSAGISLNERNSFMSAGLAIRLLK